MNSMENQINTEDVQLVLRTQEKLARGVKMEAQSIEDNGKGIKFNVFVFNVQKGVTINYSDGSSHLSNKKTSNKTPAVNKNVKYVWKCTSNPQTL